MDSAFLKRCELGKNIEEYCTENQISGVLRITVKDTVWHEQYMGLADDASRTAFDKGAMFTLYSLSKPFCAIGLLKLKDKGLVNLDCHPGNYIPEARGFDDRVTIRHMLHHISGLPDFGLNKAFAEAYAPGYANKIREHLSVLTQYPLSFAPGTGAQYANINFVCCALIIENVTGMRYADYMKNEVFVPLGMETAVVDDETCVIPNRVKGYTLLNNERVGVEKSYNWMLGAGDIVGTVDDVYCLNKAIKHRFLLSGETWKEVLTPCPLNNKGMGCTVTTWHGKKRITHNGGHTGFRTLHVQLPEDDFDIIFLSNSGFGNARKDISEMIHSAVYGNDRAEEPVIEMDSGYI